MYGDRDLENIVASMPYSIRQVLAAFSDEKNAPKSRKVREPITKVRGRRWIVSGLMTTAVVSFATRPSIPASILICYLLREREGVAPGEQQHEDVRPRGCRYSLLRRQLLCAPRKVYGFGGFNYGDLQQVASTGF